MLRTSESSLVIVPSLGVCLLVAAAVISLSTIVRGQGLEYPPARRVHQVDAYHGVQVSDPYRWMENLQSEELSRWLKSQDKLRGEFLDDTALVKRLQERIAATGNYASRGMPTRKGPNTFFTRTEIGATFGKLFVQEKRSAGPRLLLDLETLNRGTTSGFVSSYSADGRFITYNVSESQSRWHEVHVLRVKDRRVLSDELTGYYSGRSNFAWTADGDGFFYARYAVPDDPQAPLGVPQIYYHRVGTSQVADKLIYERPDDAELSFTLRVTHDGRYLIFSGSRTGGTFNGMEDRIFYKDLQAKNGGIVELFEAVDGTYAFEGSEGSRFWIRTTHEAPKARLVEVDLARPKPDRWMELIPEAEEPIQAVSEIGDRFVVRYVKDARAVARIFDHAGRLQYEIDQLAPSMFGFPDNRESDETYYGISSLFDPGTIYRLNVRTGAKELFFRPKLQHDPETFIRKQVFYRSKDGTGVPMFILHKKGLQLDGNNPVFLYAYGAWAWSAFPWQRYMIPWMELGGVYAVANIRGGGEYGESWHEDGIRRKKQNGIDDFIAAAEWLIENKYTSPAKMVANGGSASGILPAAAVVQRPELFGAAVINFPALDQLRYQHFGSAKSWIPEFGSVDDAEDFKALYAYSPYHNLEQGVCYPPTWIQVGEKDNTTTPMHGYKFAAALQAAQGCERPVLLKIAWGAGHSYGLTPEQSRETQAEELVFLVKVLNIDVGELTVKSSF